MKLAISIAWLNSVIAAATILSNADFNISIDDNTGAIWKIINPQSHNSMNWISGPYNAPWQPTGSRWGLGFADLGEAWLNRAYWTRPEMSSNNDTSSQATYNVDPLQLVVNRRLDNDRHSFTETYTFVNTGDSTLDLAAASETSFGIYTPFNEHYTNTSDSLHSRTHAHVWAFGGSSAWVKLNQMGGHGRDLGLVVTKGALAGYSIESRDTISSSNTRGVFVLHPSLPALKPKQKAELEWTFSWHDDWDDFFAQCASRSNQFIDFDVSSYTLFPEQTATANITGSRINADTTVNGEVVGCGQGSCSYTIDAGAIGEIPLAVSTHLHGEKLNSTIVLNRVPSYQDIISARTRFISKKQQVKDPDSPSYRAYIPYDNEMDKMVAFERDPDRNAARERVGMGVLLARWLKNHRSKELESSLAKYYEYICTQLQDEHGYVLDGPGSRTKRLYNWPWVMQLHLAVAELNLDLPSSLAETSPLDRFMLTLENFFVEGGGKFYPIGLPILEGLRTLKAYGNETAIDRAFTLFTNLGNYIVTQGLNYPASEVNFEQSIIGPAATILLELYRWTEDKKWLDAGKEQLTVLLRFSGKQPDYHLHDIAIRHWDGYWFGKDRMWGDTFPHYWSTINALALHHYGKATNDSSFKTQADGILRANLALFTSDGRGSCAWLYPLSVDSRDAHYKDPYANDQDWALAHFLQIEADNAYDESG